THGILNHLLEHLGTPLRHKYSWTGPDSVPPLWQVATTSALDILQTAIPYVEERYGKTDQLTVASFWARVVKITQGIVIVLDKDSLVQEANILEDESFDISCFQRLRDMIIPSLGSSYVPDKIRYEFASTIFRSSLIYQLQRADAPSTT